VRLLLLLGWSKYHGPDALTRAAGNGHLEVVRLLLEQVARVNYFDILIYYDFRVEEAAGNGHLEVVQLLLDWCREHQIPAALRDSRATSKWPLPGLPSAPPAHPRRTHGAPDLTVCVVALISFAMISWSAWLERSRVTPRL
jgi:hypothetical protein